MNLPSSKSIEDAYREAITNNIRIYLFAIRTMIEESRFGEWWVMDPKKHEKYIKNTGGKIILVSDLESGKEQFMQIIDEWNHLKRIYLYVNTSGKSQSGLEISVTRKGVKVHHNYTPQLIPEGSGYNNPSQIKFYASS